MAFDEHIRLKRMYSKNAQMRIFGAIAKSHITPVSEIPELFVKSAIAWGLEFDNFNDLLIDLWEKISTDAEDEISKEDKDFVKNYCVINCAKLLDDQIERGDYWLAFDFRKRKCYIVPNLNQVDFDVDNYD